MVADVPYNRKYWGSIWRFGPKPSETKYWRNLNLEVAPLSVLCHHQYYVRGYQGALSSSWLRYLNKAVSLQIRKKYNWQCASTVLVICTAHVDGCPAVLRVLLHALHQYALRAKIVLADFILVVSTLTA